MKRAILSAAICLASAVHAQSVQWLCNTSASTQAAIKAAAADSEQFHLAELPRKQSRYRIDLVDLQQAYQGQPVFVGRKWLLVVMLPASHPDTRAAFAELGINPEAAERMASDTGLVDRGIRLVQTQQQMLDKVAQNKLTVGYTTFFLGGRDVAPCF